MGSNEQLPAFELLVISEEFEESSEYWQRQCCFLYNNISRNITEGSVELLTCDSSQGDRGIIEAFNILSFSGLSAKGIEQVFEKIKAWMAGKPKAKIKMKFANGNEIEISGVTGFSKSEILDLFERSLQTNQV